jgi:hypothetical protein
VLRLATIPNIKKNLSLLGWQHECASALFVDGDFESAGHLLGESDASNDMWPFDCILSSETIYNTESARQLLNCCDLCLSKSGVVLIAAKSYYFGVGGSTSAFKRLIDQDMRFLWTLVYRVDDGNNNVREILSLRRRNGF